MTIYDELYGQAEVDDVLVELMATQPMQRLKGIHQAGAVSLVNPDWNVTRYDHSIGVMLLIKRLGGSLEEQIAGLLHDISHTAFSHVIDIAFNIKEENYHETIYEQVIVNSEIPTILEAYHIDLHNVFDLNRWTILEQPLPKLCADRIDYTLRDMHRYFGVSKTDIDRFLDALLVVDGQVCVTSIDMAEWFTDMYYQLVIDYFLHPHHIYSNQLLAKMMNLSLEKGIITRSELLLDDAAVLERIKLSEDPDILSVYNAMLADVDLEENEQEYDIHHLGKERLIDPPVYLSGVTVQPASIHSKRVRMMIDIAKETYRKGVHIKINNQLMVIE